MLQMREASKTWDSTESLASIEKRIHDGWPVDRLHERGDELIATMFKRSPFIHLSESYSALEIGPGVGYLMQALDRAKPAGSVTGLDVAANMAAHGKERMVRDALTEKPFRFETYDGVNFPFPDNSFDLVYSIAAIQHIPKPFAYNIFLEATRVVKPTGSVCLHLANVGYLDDEKVSFNDEVKKQINNLNDHWHHFYTEQEMDGILRFGMKVPAYKIATGKLALWASWTKSAPL